MDASESAWLGEVGVRLGAGDGITMDDETKRLLLRITKVTADATGIRYLAPLTAYLIGRAAGRADARGENADLRAVAESIARLASDWPRSVE
jgi:hypothetical protein